MREISVDTGTLKMNSVVPLGIQGECRATQIIFDISDLIQTYGNGTAALLHQRRLDAAAYPVAVSRRGSELVWEVTGADTATAGSGRAEIQWYVGEKVAKTVVFNTMTTASLEVGELPPDPVKPWYERLVEEIKGLREHDGSGDLSDTQIQTAVALWLETHPVQQGEKGEKGETGAPGRDGAPGKDGVDGKDGYTPIKGVDYFDGAPGRDGVDGKDGAPGTTPNLSVGTVVTLAPGSQATATITGTAEEPKLNLGIPSGGGSSGVINLYKGAVIENGYFNPTSTSCSWVDNTNFKTLVLPLNAVSNGDTLTFSPDTFNSYGEQTMVFFAEDNSYLKYIRNKNNANTVTLSGLPASGFYMTFRVMASYDSGTFVVVKGTSLDNVVSGDGDAVSAASPLAGKKINCLGDSFTTVSRSWHYFIAQRTGCTINNYGVSSSRISVDVVKTGDETDENGNPINKTVQSFINRAPSMDKTADMTIIFGGINDAWSLDHKDIALGDINSAMDTTTFYGALKGLIALIQYYLPGKKIFGVIPPDFAPTHYYLETLPQIQAACREVYAYYGIPYADLRRNCQEMYENDYNNATFRKVTEADANYHPSEAGYQAISEVIQGVLETHVRA